MYIKQGQAGARFRVQQGLVVGAVMSLLVKDSGCLGYPAVGQREYGIIVPHWA
jgi:hypothetical protein